MWHYDKNKRRYVLDVNVRENVSAVWGGTATGDAHTYTHDELVLPGHLAESTGIAAMKNGSITSFDHSENYDHAYTSLRPAHSASTNIVGVSLADNAVQRHGHALVWVIRPTTSHLPITGSYNWSVNGINMGMQIIFHNADNSFLLARTADDELEKIRLRLEALTNTVID